MKLVLKQIAILPETDSLKPAIYGLDSKGQVWVSLIGTADTWSPVLMDADPEEQP